MAQRGRNAVSGKLHPFRLIGHMSFRWVCQSGAVLPTSACESPPLSSAHGSCHAYRGSADVLETERVDPMTITRRFMLKAVGALPLAAGHFVPAAFAQTAPAESKAGEVPPVLFVHGNGDYAALWMTTLWRMESNGVPRERMLAINFTDPLARTEDKVEQAGRSSTEDQRRELSDAIKELKRSTGAARVALVGNSRGGNPIRNYVKNGGGGDVSHAVLCGVPNHGVYAWDEGLGGEFNGSGPFLRGLNAGENEVTDGTAFLTLRSDGIDKYAQADGRFVGKPGVSTGVTSDG